MVLFVDETELNLRSLEDNVKKKITAKSRLFFFLETLKVYLHVISFFGPWKLNLIYAL